jgi:hypothetical protein
MDNLTTNQFRPGIDAIVEVLDKEINRQCSHCLPIALPSDFAAILAIPRTRCPNIILSISLLEKLCQKNIFFKNAIDHFTYIARKKFEGVTADTLDSIDSPTILSLFPECLAKYIINCAQAQAPYSYTMHLASETGADIIDYDVCSKTDSAVISSAAQSGYTLQLWDLKTAQPTHTFDEKKYISRVCFNTSGTQLAANIQDEGKPHIKIWNSLSKIILHIIPHDTACHYLGYSTDADANMLCMASQAPSQCHHYLIDEKDCKCKYLGRNDGVTPIAVVAIKNMLTRDTYTAERVLTTPSRTSHIRITKSGCHEMYLCDRAIDTAHTLTQLTNIKNSYRYQQLTRYEKGCMNNKVNKIPAQ